MTETWFGFMTPSYNVFIKVKINKSFSSYPFHHEETISFIYFCYNFNLFYFISSQLNINKTSDTDMWRTYWERKEERAIWVGSKRVGTGNWGGSGIKKKKNQIWY